MTSELRKDINEIYTRIFDHRQFLSGEIQYFLKEFELERKDREVDNLFQAVQDTIDVRDTKVEKCRILAETNLPLLKIKLDETVALCESLLNKDIDSKADKELKEKRVRRVKVWERFVDDIKHKKSSIENTFEEKEEELREFYSDLEQKLRIHK